MIDNSTNQYSWFKAKKDQLSTLMGESSDAINQLAMKKFAERLKELGQKVGSDTFKIQIVGTFKNGKSTFINALLGEDILPTRALPCTAVVNEVKYGEKKRAILNFVDPLPEKLISGIPTPTLEHMKKYKMKKVPPMEIEYDNMEKYVTIPITGDPEQIAAQSPYRSVELYYPSKFLKEGVEIVDSPGLNESPTRTKVTLEYLDQADAIIYLFDATGVCAQDEMETIEDILIPKGFKDMFFIVNRFDLIDESERQSIKDYVQIKAGEFTTRPIFYISALQAVKGKINNDAELYKQSGLGPFEEALSNFLTKDKGKIKLTQPARELNEILTKEVLFKAIPDQRRQLETSLDTLKARYDSVKPQLADLETRKKELYAQMMLRIEQSENELRRAVLNEYRDIGRSIPAWIDDFNPTTSIGLGQKSRIKKIADEIVEHVSEKTKAGFAEWNKEVLVPLVQEKAKYIFESTDRDLSDIFKSIDEVNAQITGKDIDAEGASGWERVAGLATMLFAGSTGAAIMVGGVGKGADLIKHFALDLGVGTGLLLLGLTNPVIALAAVVGLIAKGLLDGKGAAMGKIKRQISDEIVKSVQEEGPAKAKEISDKMKAELTKVANSAVGAVDIEIDNVKSQVEAIMQEMAKGQDQVDKRKALLGSCEKRLQKVNNDLSSLILELAGTV